MGGRNGPPFWGIWNIQEFESVSTMKPFTVTERIVFWCFFTVKIRTNIFNSACWKVYDAAAEYLWPEDSQLLEGSVKDKIYADKLAV